MNTNKQVVAADERGILRSLTTKRHEELEEIVNGQS